MGWAVVDYRADPPALEGNLVRSERTQAAYVTDVLAAFAAMSLYAAHASGTSDDWHWEPKTAFHALARAYRAAFRG